MYELEQKTAVAAEAKSVLDSWVRYEGQQKAKQQKEMAESIIAKIQKELENPKTLQQILQHSVIDVESKSRTSPNERHYRLTASSRDCSFKGTIDHRSARISSHVTLSIESNNKSIHLNLFLYISNVWATRRRPAPTFVGAVARSPIQLPKINSKYFLFISLPSPCMTGLPKGLRIWPRHFIEKLLGSNASRDNTLKAHL